MVVLGGVDVNLRNITCQRLCRIDKPKTQNRMKQKSHSPELISRPLVTRASQENDAAKIQKILELTKEKLNSLAESYNQRNY